MADRMTDEEFLSYCDSMTYTERCGFVPQTIARLLRLADREAIAQEWDKQPNQIISGCHDEIRDLVAEARHLSAQGWTPPQAESGRQALESGE